MDKSTIKYIFKRLLIAVAATLFVIVFVLFPDLKTECARGTPSNDGEGTEAQSSHLRCYGPR
ncbi:hypothetical protein [Dubosiella newyorkensis]|uniref:hypothetical protein n=1 Tax=Dubosiella newyorkensis TaxID=1862672 RepID=UPI003F681BBF